MALRQYRDKRSFTVTPEPRGSIRLAPPRAKASFCVQQHQASHLHYDFRLEVDGVLKSWAVPKGPSLDPTARRLAMQVEDHPLEYLQFEGSIPAGNYGAGEVIVWDVGSYVVLGAETAAEQLAKGGLKFHLSGKKLQGEFALARMRPRRTTPPSTKADDGRQWLLIKKRDGAAVPGYVPEQQPASVLTGRTLQQVPGPRNPALRSARGHRGVTQVKADPKPHPAAKTARPGRRRRAAPRKAVAGSEEEVGKRAAHPQSLLRNVPGAVVGQPELPPHPMLATLSLHSFSSPEWLFEIKWDGVRALTWLKDGEVRVWSRNGREITPEYPELQALADVFQGKAALVDGEIVALDDAGRSNFSALQPRMHVAGAAVAAAATRQPVVYYAFDLLHLDGVQLLHTPLEKRKELLRQRLRDGSPIRFGDHVVGDGEGLLQLARSSGLEGIVAKHRHASYEPRRSSWWLKWKLTHEQEAAIVGYTDPRGSRRHFGSLLLALREGRGWRYIGHVGTGFDQGTLATLHASLQKASAIGPPKGAPPHRPAGKGALHWVEPRLVAQVKYAEWTPDGKLRAPVFLGLREDKAPDECVREREVAS